MMMTIHKKPEWFFYPGWVALTALSLPVAWVISWGIIKQVVAVVGATVVIAGRTRITEDWLGVYVLVPVLGLTTGLFQYLLLRRYLPRMGRWVWATVLGWPLAAVAVSFLATLLPGTVDTNADWLVYLMISLFSGLVGFMQWLVLRGRLPRAGWWIPATIAGWLAVRMASGDALVGPMDIMYLAVLPALATSVALWLLLAPLSPLPEA